MGKKHIPSQNNRILAYIAQHGSITCLEAERDLGIQRLAARISDLKDLGFVFSSRMIEAKNRYGEKCRVKQYMLENENG